MSKRKVPQDGILKEYYLDKKYSSGMIAKEFNCARVSVCKHLRRLGIVRPEEGINSRNRNFHKKQYKCGYPVTFLPQHERANNIGYVFDHILVIEKKINRCPNKNEPVHHIDFDRKNCKKENLYLCKNHSGHAQIHSSFEALAQELIKQKIVIFKNGEYCLGNAVSVPVVKAIGERLIKGMVNT